MGKVWSAMWAFSLVALVVLQYGVISSGAPFVRFLPWGVLGAVVFAVLLIAATLALLAIALMRLNQAAYKRWGNVRWLVWVGKK